MTTQKTFKQRVRARAAKTGESYTAARAQLIGRGRAGERAPGAPGAPDSASVPLDTMALAGVSAETMVDRTGRPLEDWFAVLDAWGAGERTHTDIARWLRTEHGVDGWWSQTVTVAYERARGRRVLHQTAAGFSVGVTRTVDGTHAEVTAMFDDPARRATWHPGAPLEVNAGYRGRRGRYDWSNPPSKVWVDVVARGEARATVTVTHEGLPDADAAEAMKVAWRDALDRLRGVLAAR